LSNSDKVKKIYGDQKTLKRCIADPKFPYVIALARAVNALNSAHSLMMSTTGKDTPAAIRDRTNAYLFISAILYETLKLIRTMCGPFKGDTSFETHLRVVLEDTHSLAKNHLKDVRSGGVFHFLPDRFATAIAKTPMDNCVFASTIGSKRGEVNYDFADLIVVEMMVGTRLDNQAVVDRMTDKTLKLVVKFIEASETFIGDQLIRWRFGISPA
jgi:hypothetical protein